LFSPYLPPNTINQFRLLLYNHHPWRSRHGRRQDKRNPSVMQSLDVDVGRDAAVRIK